MQSLLERGMQSDAKETEVIPTIIGSLVNKLPESDYGFEAIRANCITVIDSTKEFAMRRRAVILFSWITKALVIKGHKSAHEMVEYLLKKLEEPDLAHIVCEGVEIILKDHELGYLTKQCFAVQKVSSNLI